MELHGVRAGRLSREQAARLQRAYRVDGDLAARERLIEAYLPLARSLARRFAHRGERVEDLEQVGSIGLIKAVDRFEPSRGVDLAAFAVPNIVGEIQRHLRDRSSLIRVPRREQEENAQLGRPRRQLALTLTDETSPVSTDDEFQASEDRVAVSTCLRSLHRRERQVLRCRYFGDMSQTEIAERLEISQTHASRLLASGLAKLRANLVGNSDFPPASKLHSHHGDSRRRQGRAA